MPDDLDLQRFRIAPGEAPRLAYRDPGATGPNLDKHKARARLADLGARLRELQYLLYAEQQRSLLVVLQAMDAGGKDGTIRHVFACMNPQGVRVTPFRQPTATEAAHDFLWRIHRATPGRGEVAIFNRSHYEDVLIARVHKLVPRKVWQRRYRHINEFESLLADEGTVILKFFLHISAEEQWRRLRRRLDDPHRHWKISEADFSEHRYWDDYQQAYEDALAKCSTEAAPWYVIPANHKWYRNLVVSRILVEHLESLHLRFPEPRVDIASLRKRYFNHRQEDETP